MNKSQGFAWSIMFLALTVSLQFLPATAGTAQTGKELAWIGKGKEAVKARLKDPKSADFRNVFFHRGVDGLPMTCGEVNSKNSFGGYTGFQKFVSGGSADTTFLEDEVADFAVVWNRLCA
jgi:hypothetical protein